MCALRVFFVTVLGVDEGLKGHTHSWQVALRLECLIIGRLARHMVRTGLLGNHFFGVLVDVMLFNSFVVFALAS